MGLTVISDDVGSEHYHTHKAFLLANYILIGAASSCIFLTLSLRLIPSLCGLSLIALHLLTIAGAISGCTAASNGSTSNSLRSRWYAVHMVSTVLTAIFQGAVAVLIFTRTSDFLSGIKSYVREDDGAIILRMGGGLCVVIFCLEWVVLVLAFVLKYYAYVESGGGGLKRSGKVGHDEELNDWPWPLQGGGGGGGLKRSRKVGQCMMRS